MAGTAGGMAVMTGPVDRVRVGCEVKVGSGDGAVEVGVGCGMVAVICTVSAVQPNNAMTIDPSATKAANFRIGR